tara:strand:+ start:227 stop:427 length:201 start_codon:yes stop_codon:yes gene_type:complete
VIHVPGVSLLQGGNMGKRTFNQNRYYKEKLKIEQASGNCWWLKQYILGDLRAKRERSANESSGYTY